MNLCGGRLWVVLAMASAGLLLSPWQSGATPWRDDAPVQIDVGTAMYVSIVSDTIYLYPTPVGEDEIEDGVEQNSGSSQVAAGSTVLAVIKYPGSIPLINDDVDPPRELSSKGVVTFSGTPVSSGLAFRPPKKLNGGWSDGYVLVRPGNYPAGYPGLELNVDLAHAWTYGDAAGRYEGEITLEIGEEGPGWYDW